MNAQVLEIWHLHYHLLSSEEGVSNEFARTQRDWLLSVCHGYKLYSIVSKFTNVFCDR